MNGGRFAKIFSDIIFSKEFPCMGCGSEAVRKDGLCDRCRLELKILRIISACPICGHSSKEGNICSRCQHTKHEFDRAFAVFAYHEPIREIIRKYKFSGRRYYAEGFWNIIAESIPKRVLDKIDVITAVPLHPKRLKQRGFNQAELLARGVAVKTGLEYRELLIRTVYTPEQSLSKDRRSMTGHFKGIGEIKGNILLIDDVLTTGSTVDGCALALKEAGADKVYVLTLAGGR